MKMRATGPWALAAAGLVAVGFGSVLFNPAPAAAPHPAAADAHAPADAGFTAWRGVSSCSSSACHNQDAGRGDRGGGYAKGSEYALWVDKDPHGRAYQVLFDKRSVDIQKKLNALAPPEKQTLANHNILCLRCHVAPEAVDAVDAAPVWFSDGVGCESCHGRAGEWLAEHIGPGWKQMSAAEKAAHHFNNTKDLAVRARTCTACHVGGDRAEVNHDLYAAGHPPLQYEYSSFLDRYRPYQHWSEADDRRRNPAYEAEAWAVGQAVTARAALHLLATRAKGVVNDREEKAAQPRPWPEFAEYDCSSCHHGLEQQRFLSAAPSKRGALPWSWFVSMTPLLTKDPPTDRLKTVRDEMERRVPDARKIAAGAETLGDFYDEWLKHHSSESLLDADALRSRLERLTGAEGQKIAGAGWEDARQLSFAITAHYRSLEAAQPDSGAAAAVRRLTEDLRVPADQDTPGKFDAREVARDLQEIRKHLGLHN